MSCPLCGDPAPPGQPCPPGGRHCPRCGSELWPAPVTRPRGSLNFYFNAPTARLVIPPRPGSLLGLMAELDELRRAISEVGRPRPSRFAGFLASIRRTWHRLLAVRKPRPNWSGPSGVSDPWID